MKKRKEPSSNYLDTAVKGIVTSLKKQYTRRDKILLDSGHYDTETWGALKKCWRGYKIAKSEFDDKKMEYYAKGIRKFQRELNISVTEFSRFGLMGTMMPHEQDPENVFDYGNRQIEREREQYESQIKQEQDLIPYHVEPEPEPDLPKEQEEYYKRIRRYFMDPGSFVS